MNAFLVDVKLITDKKQIREMWADHFEALGTPSISVRYDDDFVTRVTTSVKDIFNSCTEDPSGVECGITARHSRFILPKKKIVRDKICDSERRAWNSFCESHPDMRVVQSCLENVSAFRFWSPANQLPDLVSLMHV